ncbi:hypothetical protein [Streptomyces deccanensis]|uniref:hypothetical protein n=1 Tax=Streptomyces deccanensis TaxID=424188 RepID=UPI001EFA3722|nr:hypothetical protein [Streptomyces deccanensis]ULR51882.1 hypothetical protein L3078_22755 [Streptomyces deccanensis]
MATRVVEPRLVTRPLSTVPQCLDNQFLPRELFGTVSQAGDSLKALLDSVVDQGRLGVEDSDAPEEYGDVQRVEYMRSLLFSRNVIVNRTAFWNTPMLVGAALSDDGQYLAELMSGEVIVPFLFEETDFSQKPDGIDVLPHGENAISRLASTLQSSELTCARLGGLSDIEQRENTSQPEEESLHEVSAHEVEVGEMALNFGMQFSKLSGDDSVRQSARVVLAKALLSKAHKHVKAERISRLAAKIRSVADWVSEQNGLVRRGQMYEKFVTYGNPVTSRYRTDEFTYEIKQWIDLVYNSNLPSKIGVLSYVPQGFPTPFEARIAWPLGGPPVSIPDAEGELTDIAERAHLLDTWRTWDAFQQTAQLAVPDPSELTHADIVFLRDSPEWKAMIEALEKNLYAQTQNDQTLTEIYDTYKTFQAMLASWSLESGKQTRSERAIAVAKIYRWGSWFLGFFSHMGDLVPIAPPPDIVELAPAGEGAVEVTVEIGLYAFDWAKIDFRRSQLVRGMKRIQKVNAQHLRDLQMETINSARERGYYNYPGHDAYAEPSQEDKGT